MRTKILYLNKLVFSLLPETRFFGLKRSLLRLAGAKIGRNVRICSSVSIIGSGTLEIGDNTWISERAMIVCTSKISIGANCDIAPRVYIGDGTHEITIDGDRIAGILTTKPISIGNGCWLCANSTILPGVTLADKTVVAAGAVVAKKNEEEKALIAGVPAKKVKDLSK